MPVSLSAKKSLRSSIAKRKGNLAWRKKLKDVLRIFNKNPDKKKLDKVYSVLDKVGKRNIFHKNKVSRLKARYSKVVASLSVKKDSSKKKK